MFWIVILFLFLFLAAIAKAYFKKKEQSKALSSYQKKDRVMNESEQALFINLQKVLGEEYILLSKVRIEDFVKVGKDNIARENIWGLRNRIKSRHVDFLICDRETTKPLFAIELDGKSHNSMDQQKRDQFIDDLYKTINLPIEHVHVGGNFLELSQKIQNAIKSSTS